MSTGRVVSTVTSAPTPRGWAHLSNATAERRCSWPSTCAGCRECPRSTYLRMHSSIGHRQWTSTGALASALTRASWRGSSGQKFASITTAADSAASTQSSSIEAAPSRRDQARSFSCASQSCRDSLIWSLPAAQSQARQLAAPRPCSSQRPAVPTQGRADVAAWRHSAQLNSARGPDVPGSHRSRSGTWNASQTARQTFLTSSPSASAWLTVRSPRAARTWSLATLSA